MASLDKIEWEKASKVEHKKMPEFNGFEVVHPKDVPDQAKLFTSTWAVKKKPDGTYRARNAIREGMNKSMKFTMMNTTNHHQLQQK